MEESLLEAVCSLTAKTRRQWSHIRSARDSHGHTGSLDSPRTQNLDANQSHITLLGSSSGRSQTPDQDPIWPQTVDLNGIYGQNAASKVNPAWTKSYFFPLQNHWAKLIIWAIWVCVGVCAHACLRTCMKVPRVTETCVCRWCLVALLPYVTQ